MLGVERLISVSAVGSLKIEYAPTDIVVPDQFFDRTHHRPDTFFGDGIVAHVSIADPVCPQLFAVFGEAGAGRGRQGAPGRHLPLHGRAAVFDQGRIANLYRSWGVDVIGMTNLQEAKLAREAEICYATLAMVTDYDCWHESEEAVSGEAVMKVIQQNSQMAQEVVRRIVHHLAPGERSCPCATALAASLITERSLVPAATVEKLRPIIGKYFV